LPPKITANNHSWIYGVDGKWLRKAGVVIIHRDVSNGENLYWSYWRSESYLAYGTDLKRLSALLGNRLPYGTTSDWLGAIVTAIASHFDNIPHQRCLTHVVRHAKRYLAENSPFKATRVLREIAKQLIHVKDEDEKRQWLAKLIRWEKQYDCMLWERTIAAGSSKRRWWYTHGNLRRGWRLLTNDWYPFFVHLDHQSIPHSNNSLEGTISQAKNKLSNHRGMKTLQQVSFLFWYLTFTRVKTRHDLKKLWDAWKISQ